MAKGKSTWKYNKLLTARRNYYSFGGGVAGILDKAAGAVGQAGGKAISGNLSSGAGNAISGIGNAVGSIVPGPWGSVIKLGSGLIGGLANRMFGSHLNEENIEAVKNDIARVNNFTSNASDFDTLANTMASTSDISNFSNSFIGQDGWFSNKAENIAKDLRGQLTNANTRQALALSDNAENITDDIMSGLLGNYAAYGGAINRFGDGGDKFDTSRVDFNNYVPFLNRKFIPENMEQIQDSLIARRLTKPVRAAVLSTILHESGGDPKATSDDGLYKGLVQWGKERYPNTENLGEQIHYLLESMQDSKSPNWGDGGVGAPKTNSGKEAFNGFWKGYGPYYTSMYFNKGYVRPGATNNKDKAKRALQTRINRGVEATRIYKNMKSFGGDLLTHGSNFDTGVTLIGNGGTHEENPNEGVPMGMDAEGTPNLVEEGEVIFNDYVFSNRLKVPKEVRKKYKLRGTKPLTFAEAATQMSKESEERPNDPISKAGLEDGMAKLMVAQEQVRENQAGRRYAKGGKLGRRYDGTGDLPQQLLLDRSVDMSDFSWMDELDSTKSKSTTSGANSKLAPTWMRYVPAYASGIMSLTDALGLTNKPDYSEADMVLDAARGAGNYSPVGFSPIGNYLGYTPFDREFYINQMNAQAGATRRAIMQSAGLNRGAGMAALLASDYNTQGQFGQLARQAEEYNLAQRQRAEEFNRATNMFNTEGALKADMANQEAMLKVRDSYLKGTLSAAELRQRERQQAAAARSANLSNFINSLGDIGRENFVMNQINENDALLYGVGRHGESGYKGKAKGTKEKYGGFLTKKGRRK